MTEEERYWFLERARFCKSKAKLAELIADTFSHRLTLQQARDAQYQNTESICQLEVPEEEDGSFEEWLRSVQL